MEHLKEIGEVAKWLQYEMGEWAEGAWASRLSYEETKAGWVGRIRRDLLERWPVFSEEEANQLIGEYFTV